MSDITPADALRELGDDQAEYAAAAAKKLGPEPWQIREALARKNNPVYEWSVHWEDDTFEEPTNEEHARWVAKKYPQWEPTVVRRLVAAWEPAPSEPPC